MINFHWKELKYRFCYWLLNYSMIFLMVWHYKLNILFNVTDLLLIFTSLTEAFYAYVYFSLMVSLLLSLPFLIYEYVLFLMPGLYEFEFIKQIKSIMLFMCLLFIFYLLGFNWLMEIILGFLLGFESSDLMLNLKITEFVSFYVCFVLFFVFMVLVLMLKPELRGKRRILYMFFMLLLGVLTPPDVFSLLVCWLLLILLFEIGYLIDNIQRLK